MKIPALYYVRETPTGRPIQHGWLLFLETSPADFQPDPADVPDTVELAELLRHFESYQPFVHCTWQGGHTEWKLVGRPTEPVPPVVWAVIDLLLESLQNPVDAEQTRREVQLYTNVALIFDKDEVNESARLQVLEQHG